MKTEIEAQAYLRNLRNVARGLKARSGIIAVMKMKRTVKGREVAGMIDLSYSSTMRHLRNMKAEQIVEKAVDGWRLTGLGQQAVTEYLRDRKDVK